MARKGIHGTARGERKLCMDTTLHPSSCPSERKGRRHRLRFVMANGSLSSTTGGEGAVRRQIIKKDLVDCIVAMPPQLFLTTGIPVCLWFLTRDKSGRYLDKGCSLRRIVPGKPCLSTPETWAKWRRAHYAISPAAIMPSRHHRGTPISDASFTPITLGAANTTRASTPMSQASARLQR